MIIAVIVIIICFIDTIDTLNCIYKKLDSMERKLSKMEDLMVER